MNFFEHQDQARRKTGRLVLLFVVAVIMILIAVNAATFGILQIVSPHMAYVEDAAPVFRGDLEYPRRQARVRPLWNEPWIYLAVTLGTLLVIGGGTAYKTASLSAGGRAVAQMLGGRPLDPAAAQGQDRVLMNVVEEMSIASGIPVPAVYVMENEKGINAFAAGFTTEDAVIGVTRGCVEKLTRDELQGVVAHEFSHILNGDMRLNIRLIGILHGILVIGLIGFAILRSVRYVRVGGGSRRSDKGGGNVIILILLAGAAMLVIGYVGVFFGRLIQAAVSRQREYLADASAVQFTRNANGIAGALKKIGAFSAGSHVENYHAVETAHLFFSTGVKVGLSSLLATHPPLKDRIKRIDPTFDGRLPLLRELQTPAPQQQPSPAAAPRPGPRPQPATPLAGGIASGFAERLHHPKSAQALSRARMALDPASVVRQAGAPTPAGLALAGEIMHSLPPELLDAAHDPFSARAVVFALTLSADPDVRAQQYILLGANVEPACRDDVRRLADKVAALGTQARLPLVDLALPALRQLSPNQVDQFRKVVRALVEADKRVTLFEYALLKIIAQNLRPSGERARKARARYFAVNAVRDEAAVLLTALAHASEHDTQLSFDAGARRLDAQRPPAMAPSADLRTVNAALDRLEHASPPVKQRIVEACAATVAADGQVSLTEAELLRAIASAMDVPLPPLVAAAESLPEHQAVAASGR